MRTRTMNYLKKTLVVVIAIGSGNLALAQVEKNYIKTYSPRTAVTTEAEVTTGSYLIVNQTTQYVDGFGRPIQSVSKRTSPLYKDIVQHREYDEFGRMVNSYLPHVGGTDGLFKSTAETDQESFYNVLFPGESNYAFSHTEFEASPLNRADAQIGPGSHWTINDKKVRIERRSNIGGEVYSWEVTPMGDSRLTDSFFYGANELFVEITKDEDWISGDARTVQAFTDKLGQKVLTRVFDETAEPHDTYYIYDDFGNLRMVIPPEGVQRLGSSLEGLDNIYVADEDLPDGADQAYYYMPSVTVTMPSGNTYGPGFSLSPYPLDASMVQDWVFKYEYDGRRRMISKKVPGADEVFMVYDERDRLVMTQDGNQRLNDEWGVTKYDVLNRPIMTGVYTHSSTIDQVGMTGEISTTNFSEIYNGTGAHGYTNNVWPLSGVSYRTVTYYDNYDILGYSTAWPGTDWGYDNSQLGSSFPSDENTNAMGQIIGSKVVILDGTFNTWLQTVSYYDDRYRVIQTKSENFLNDIKNKDVISNRYSFINLEETKTEHNTSAGSHDILRTFDYDHAGRLLTVTHQIDAEPEVILIKNDYNELGELVTKNQYSQDGGTSFSQAVDFDYNIRGWLKAINGGTSFNSATDLFGMELMYQAGTDVVDGNPINKLYNGNIAAMKWKSSSPGEVKAMDRIFAYDYDGLNRLTDAIYASKSTTGYNLEENDFDVTNLDYDKNGNILSLDRNGDGNPIDELTYTYSSGNQLSSVTDGPSGTDEGFKDGTNTGDDYAYDDNGNMISDNNKGITITYNELNLPHIVTKGSDQIEYIYDAAGIKLRQEVTGAITKSTDYIGEAIYEDNVLQFLQHEEGRVTLDASVWDYQFNLTDHLGNVRLTYSTKEEETEYLATMESENAAQEDPFFEGLDSRFTPMPSTINHTPGGNEVAMLDGARKVGPGIVLKVNPGDIVDMEVQAIHMDNFGYGSQEGFGVMAAAVAQAFGGGGGAEQQLVHDALNAAYVLVGGSSSPNKPSAYLNYILLDDDLEHLQHGYKGVTSTAYGNHEQLNRYITVSQPGYIFVFVSNESSGNSRVYFDDLKVTHTQKMQVIQDDDYYPFGLTFNSYQRPSGKKNRFLYNDGVERVEELDLGIDLTAFRAYDPALGRWWQIDPIEKYHESPYAWVTNNPIRFNDPWGLDTTFVAPILDEVIIVAEPEEEECVGDNCGNGDIGVGMAINIEMPSPFISNTRVDPGAITTAAENALSYVNTQFAYKEKACNIGVSCAVEELIGYPDLGGMLANTMAEYLENSPNWTPIKVGEVQGTVNVGGVVVAVSTNSSGSGHVVMGVPGTEAPSGFWGGTSPVGMDTGSKKKWSSKGMSYSWGSKTGVKFYEYTGQISNQ